jgi:hypothetical protein
MIWAIDLSEGIRKGVGEDAWSSLGELLRPQTTILIVNDRQLDKRMPLKTIITIFGFDLGFKKFGGT